MKKNLYLLFLVMGIGLVYPQPNTAQKRHHPRTWAASHVISPANGAVVSAEGVKILVSIVPRANRYTLELSRHADFSGDIKRYPSSRIVFLVSDLEKATKYYARVKTNRSGYGKTSTFTTEQMSDVTVSIIGSGTGDADYGLIAMGVQPEGSSSYSVAISSSPDFKKDTKSYSSLYNGQNEFVVTDLRDGKKYYSRASAEDGIWGPVVPFHTRKKAKSQQLWGVTSTGGANNQGTIFSFDPESGQFQKRLDYQHEIEWVYLSGNLVRTPNGLTGVSAIDATGGGEVFTFKPDGSLRILESYGPHDGSVMLGTDNQLYIVDDWINVFQGGIYKMHSGGDDVFPPDRIIYSFESDEHGLNPKSQLVQSGKYIFGNAPYGGAAGKGTIFRGAMDGSDFDVIHHFKGPEGEAPSGALVTGDSDYLYGVTELGGSTNEGVIYRVKQDGTAFKTIFSFSAANGAFPKGQLLWHNGRIYGATSAGGRADQGVIFSIRPDGSEYRVLHHFSGSDGGSPLGGLTVHEGRLFGMTSRGGAHNLGVIFEIRSDGSGFSRRFDFSEETGGAPDGTLLLTEDFHQQNDVPASSSTSENTALTGISIYPNPFRNSFSAVFDGETQHSVEFIVSDMSGDVIFRRTSKANMPVEMGENLQKGLYVLKILEGDKVTTRKIIKE